MKSYNGNRMLRNIIKMAQWNMGNSKWESKKLEIEALALEKSPDILFITEANLWSSLPEVERKIAGYTLHYPQAMMTKAWICQDSTFGQKWTESGSEP